MAWSGQLGGHVDQEVARAAAHHVVEDLVAAGGQVGLDRRGAAAGSTDGVTIRRMCWWRGSSCMLNRTPAAKPDGQVLDQRPAAGAVRRRCPTRTSPHPWRPTARRRGGSGSRSPRRRACARSARARTPAPRPAGGRTRRAARRRRTSPGRSGRRRRRRPRRSPGAHGAIEPQDAYGRGPWATRYPRDGVELVPGSRSASARAGRSCGGADGSTRRCWPIAPAAAPRDLYHSALRSTSTVSPRPSRWCPRGSARRARRRRRGPRRDPAARPVTAVPLRGAVLARRVDPRRRRRGRGPAGERRRHDRPPTSSTSVVATSPPAPGAATSLGTGDMWNSNSLASWLLAVAGVDLTSIGLARRRSCPRLGRGDRGGGAVPLTAGASPVPSARADHGGQPAQRRPDQLRRPRLRRPRLLRLDAQRHAGARPPRRRGPAVRPTSTWPRRCARRRGARCSPAATRRGSASARSTACRCCSPARRRAGPHRGDLASPAARTPATTRRWSASGTAATSPGSSPPTTASTTTSACPTATTWVASRAPRPSRPTASSPATRRCRCCATTRWSSSNPTRRRSPSATSTRPCVHRGARRGTSPFFLYLAHLYVHLPIYVAGALRRGVAQRPLRRRGRVHRLGHRRAPRTSSRSSGSTRTRSSSSPATTAPAHRRGRQQRAAPRGSKAHDVGGRAPGARASSAGPGRIDAGRTSDERRHRAWTSTRPSPALAGADAARPTAPIDGRDLSALLLRRGRVAPRVVPYYWMDDLEAVRDRPLEAPPRQARPAGHGALRPRADPAETTDVAAEHPEVVAELAAIADGDRRASATPASGVVGERRPPHRPGRRRPCRSPPTTPPTPTSPPSTTSPTAADPPFRGSDRGLPPIVAPRSGGCRGRAIRGCSCGPSRG